MSSHLFENSYNNLIEAGLSEKEELLSKLECLLKENKKLIEALAIAKESLGIIKNQDHTDLCKSMKPYRPNYNGCHVEESEDALKKFEEFCDE